ncbi:MAG TPA: universal stress protein [Thermoleophilaceae bacterium]|jgi:nucleotide-binding universal stress UspA family protein|nr:universal stress protein [Thermoleophilaceae bacterium]
MNDVIVVGTDGSDTADVAVQRAATLAKMTGARVELVTGFREDYSLVAGTGMYVGDLAGDARKAADGCLESTAQRLRSEGIEVETHCMGGDPADAIIDIAEATDAGLIVVGSRGMRGGKRFLLGSVPNKISHHAPCSVMIVRTG